jgi:hypothetical protein
MQPPSIILPAMKPVPYLFNVVLFLGASIYNNASAQFLMDMVDTSKDVGRGLLSIYKKFDQIRIGGYMQPQYQVASAAGARGYSGGDFPPHSNNRFMLRRGRIRFDYAHFNPNDKASVQFVFQFDGTERGVFIRDFWGRIFENKWELFAFTTGMFARPFGYEVNLSSSDRESPERGRMSQILMRTERDVGAMVSFEPRARKDFLRFIKLDAGFFNGQGLTALSDFDSFKDFITRAGIKPFPVANNIWISSGVSYFNGGFRQNNQYQYKTFNNGGIPIFILDSSMSKIGTKAPRKYSGADAQVKIKGKWGFTELRAEYWQGTQTASFLASETPTLLLLTNEPYYIRQFNGAFFCFLQNIINEHHQLGVKLDWYDPNTDVKGLEIKEDNNFGPADIRYQTLGFGYIYYINENLKLTLWFDDVKNEKTNLPGFTEDLSDDVFTARLQFRF